VDTLIAPVISALKENHAAVDADEVSRAYQVARDAHEGQLRKSGEAYITHPVAVAEILAHLGLNPATVIAALLHDTVEDTQYSLSQLRIDFGTSSELDELDVEITNEIEAARGKAEKIRSIFAHESIMPDEVKKDLLEVDEAIGDVATLEAFVLSASKLLGANFEKIHGGYLFKKLNMDDWLSSALGQGDKIHISFQSPTKPGFRYIGRNHRFVEQLCHRIIANALDKERKGNKAARAAVFRTDAVNTQTTLIQFRVRNVIREVSKQHEMVSEEMFLWGYEQTSDGIHALSIDQCKILLHTSSAFDISTERQEIIFEKELQYFKTLHPDFISVVTKRSDELVNAHTRFAKYIGAKRFEAVTPVLPPDILGVYVLIPNPKIN
jgi:hypothetical protein